MTDIQWGLQDPNAFQRGYQQTSGMFDKLIEARKKAELDAAMRQYALNPNDPKAINALAMVSPTTAIDARQKQAATQKAGLEAHRENIKLGAQIIRKVQPKDQASWDQARALAQQAGVNLAEVPAQFDPEYVQNIVRVADALDPQKAESQPNIQREVDYYRSIGKPELADQLLQHHAEGPPVMVDNGNGTKTLYPRSALGGQTSGAIPPLPPGFVLDDEGGPAPGAPGGFL